MCGKGPAHLRTHTAIATVLREDLLRSGAAVETERGVPEWYVEEPDGTIKEARLDLVVRFPGASVMERIDVAIRSPFAGHFERAGGARATAQKAGVAAKAGENDKRRRYGDGVAPFVMEPLGRLGGDGQSLLCRLRRAALDFGRRRPGGGLPFGLNLRRLRARLEAALLREVADTALLALGCRSSLALGWEFAAHAAAARAATEGGLP